MGPGSHTIDVVLAPNDIITVQGCVPCDSELVDGDYCDGTHCSYFTGGCGIPLAGGGGCQVIDTITFNKGDIGYANIFSVTLTNARLIVEASNETLWDTGVMIGGMIDAVIMIPRDATSVVVTVISDSPTGDYTLAITCLDCNRIVDEYGAGTFEDPTTDGIGVGDTWPGIDHVAGASSGGWQTQLTYNLPAPLASDAYLLFYGRVTATGGPAPCTGPVIEMALSIDGGVVHTVTGNDSAVVLFGSLPLPAGTTSFGYEDLTAAGGPDRGGRMVMQIWEDGGSCKRPLALEGSPDRVGVSFDRYVLAGALVGPTCKVSPLCVQNLANDGDAVISYTFSHSFPWAIPKSLTILNTFVDTIGIAGAGEPDGWSIDINGTGLSGTGEIAGFPNVGPVVIPGGGSVNVTASITGHFTDNVCGPQTKGIGLYMELDDADWVYS